MNIVIQRTKHITELHDACITLTGVMVGIFFLTIPRNCIEKTKWRT